MGENADEELAARWLEGLGGNWAILETLSSPTMRVWHSHDNEWLTREQGTARMAESGARDQPPSFNDLRATITESGFVVQAWIDSLGEGKTHIVQVCTVEDGRVASCEEYIAPEMNLARPPRDGRSAP
jgi:hypothetical protein